MKVNDFWGTLFTLSLFLFFVGAVATFAYGAHAVFTSDMPAETPRTITITETVTDTVALDAAFVRIAELEKELGTYKGHEPLQCTKAVMWVANDFGGLYSIGESELCGYNMGWSGTYGPSFVTQLNNAQFRLDECMARNPQ
jgi:hypothetical protein